MIKVATLWLINENLEVLVAQRALEKIQDPGVWGPTVTGKVEDGEAVEQALIREAWEELRLDLKPLESKFLLESSLITLMGKREYLISSGQKLKRVSQASLK